VGDLGEIVFLHAADIHLDSPFSGLKKMPPSLVKVIRESTFKAFQQLVNAAILHKVDFLLLAGDLYDGENRSLRTQVKISKEMEKLKEAGIQVYLIHGNHDHLDGTWINVNFPENVHIYHSMPEMKKFTKHDGTTVNIYGYSYPKRHVTERIINSYQKHDDADYHIGLLHGNLEGYSEHSPYAPFGLKELIEKDFDYWALGHIHKRLIVSEQPLAIYPGNIQGRNKKESGLKGCYLVSVDGGTKKYTFVETSQVVWDDMVIEIEGDKNFDDILKHCRESLISRDTDGKTFLTEIFFNVSNHSDPSLFTDEFIEGILDVLQEDSEDMDSDIWPYKINIQAGGSVSLTEGPFIDELLATAAVFDQFEEVLSPLYHHVQARRFLDKLNDKDKNELLIESQRLLRQLF
jgi:DNA repair protein SbcD/Mre11